MTLRQAQTELDYHKQFQGTDEIVGALDLAIRLNRYAELIYQDESSYKSFLDTVSKSVDGVRRINDDLLEKSTVVLEVDDEGNATKTFEKETLKEAI